MPGAMPGSMPQMGQMPQQASQMGTGMPMPGQMQQSAPMQPPQAIPPGLGGGQQPVQMGQAMNAYGMPQVSNQMRPGAMRFQNRQY